MFDSIAEILVSILLLGGAFFALMGSFGLAKLPDFFLRVHGPTEATTLGIGLMVLASSLFFSWFGDGLSLREFLLVAFLFITAPVSGHTLSRAALHKQVPVIKATQGKHWHEDTFGDKNARKKKR